MLGPQALRIAEVVAGTKVCLTQTELGRVRGDIDVLARFFTGMGKNPNAAATLILGMNPGYGYPGLDPEVMAEEISLAKKPVEFIWASEVGGSSAMVARGIEVARALVHEVSLVRREPVAASELAVGGKCGTSDATSGIAGNPAMGVAMDLLIEVGGTGYFSETTEIIGAEEVLSGRGESPEVCQDILRAARVQEELALAAGVDIQGINPMPFNIKGGISSLEEKSLGAIAKSGTKPIRRVLEYCERPEDKGLYFMDGWEASHSLFASFAAAGATLGVYQIGGEGLVGDDPPPPAVNSGVVIPTLLITGNPKTAAKMRHSMDFSSGGIVEGTETIPEAGQRLFGKFLSVASGELARAETLRFDDQIDVYLKGPVL